MKSFDAVRTRRRRRRQLRIRCSALKRNDLLSKSDPIAAVYAAAAGGGWELVGTTEKQRNEHK